MDISEKIIKQRPLAELSTYKIGGPAEYFTAPESEEELRAAIEWAEERKLSVTVLGGGSNILVNDSGIKGLVLKPAHGGIVQKENRLIVGTNANVWDVSEYALAHSLSGIEWAIGIPGSMGGAIRGNAGAHGGSFDQVVRRVTVFDEPSRSFIEVSPADCGFAYRHSIFKEKPKQIIWEVELELAAGDRAAMEAQMEGYREYRRTSQPKEPSAGCVFKNFLAAELEKANPELVAMAAAEGKVRGGKIGAGYLIEKLQMKGYAQGGARISEKHANFVINADGAKAADVAAIMSEVKERVRQEFGVEMEEEVQYLGF